MSAIYRTRMTDTVVITRTDGVLEIRLNRPEKKNALTRAMYDAMADAFAQVDADPTLRVALLTGTGDTLHLGQRHRRLPGARGGQSAKAPRRASCRRSRRCRSR